MTISEFRWPAHKRKTRSCGGMENG
jgi:hypothetical protein